MADKRKPVSITTFDQYLVVLCNDGTIWTHGGIGDGEWSEILGIPGTRHENQPPDKGKADVQVTRPRRRV